MNQKYVVQLTDSERNQLKQIISSGTAPARKVRRAHILLKSDSSAAGANWTYKAICEAFDVSESTIAEVRRDFVQGGLAAALNRKPPRREYERRLDGEGEAHLLALACSEPPAGHERWTLRLLRRRLIGLNYVENISHETIRSTMKKMNLSLG